MMQSYSSVTLQTNYPNYHSCSYSTHSSKVTCKISVFFNFLIFPGSHDSIFRNCNNYALTAFLFLSMFTKSPRVIAMICSRTEVPQQFVSSVSSTLSRTRSYHFSFRSHSHFPERYQRTPPATLSCLLLYYFCLCQFRAHELTIWLIVLFLYLHIIIVTSSFPRVILSYSFKGLSEAPCKHQYPSY